MKKLKLILVERGISQTDFARAVLPELKPETAYTEINKLCNEKKKYVNFEILKKICNQLNLCATEILGF